MLSIMGTQEGLVRTRGHKRSKRVRYTQKSTTVVAFTFSQNTRKTSQEERMPHDWKKAGLLKILRKRNAAMREL